MSTLSHVFFRGFYENLPEGARSLVGPEQINSAAPNNVINDHLLSGDNTIDIPVTALGCLILFDSRSTVVKKLKGDAGDVGIVIHPTRWLTLSFTAAGQATFIINVSADDTVTVGNDLVSLYTSIVFF